MPIDNSGPGGVTRSGGIRELNPISTGDSQIDSPDGPVYYDTDISGATRLLAGGVSYPLSVNTVLNTTTIRMAAESADLATAAVVPFDTVCRDDLGMFTGMTAGLIKIPSNCTQFRIMFSVAFGIEAVSASTYRKLSIGIYSAGVSETMNNHGIKPSVLSFYVLTANTPQVLTTNATANSPPTITYCSPLIDTANLGTPLTTVPEDAANNYIRLVLAHDAGAGVVNISAGSSLTLEYYTPV